MSKEDTRDIDRFYEALTENKQYVHHRGPPTLSRYGKTVQSNWYCAYRKTGQDIEYRNAEGELHRIYGPAYIGVAYKFEEWYKDGEYHREGGPAVTTTDAQYWFYEGNFHRLDGPAVVKKGHPKLFFIHGQKLSPKEYKKEIDRRRRRGLIK